MAGYRVNIQVNHFPIYQLGKKEILNYKRNTINILIPKNKILRYKFNKIRAESVC